MRGFGDLEAAIMDRLWVRGEPATVREVLTDLRPEPAHVTPTVHRGRWLEVGEVTGARPRRDQMWVGVLLPLAGPER